MFDNPPVGPAVQDPSWVDQRPLQGLDLFYFGGISCVSGVRAKSVVLDKISIRSDGPRIGEHLAVNKLVIPGIDTPAGYSVEGGRPEVDRHR